MKNYKYYTAHVKVKGEVAHSVGSSVSRRLVKLAGSFILVLSRL